MSEKKREYYIRSLEEILESDWVKITHEAYFTEGAIKDLLELLKEEPERKKGEWINKEFYGIGEGSAECSICHKRSSGYKEDDGWGVHCLFYDFCPNCGADMRGEQK